MRQCSLASRAARMSPPLAALALLLALFCTPFAFATQADAIGSEQGRATYYGNHFDGALTASGEPFSNQAMTAAHRSLPFGTKVQVTNLENGKQTIVKINDRGPFVSQRIIDLSQSAAERLDMVDRGVARVRVSVID